MSMKYHCDLCKEDIRSDDFPREVVVDDMKYHVHGSCRNVLGKLFTSKNIPTIIISHSDTEQMLIDGNHSECISKQIRVGPGEHFISPNDLGAEYAITNHDDKAIFFSVTTKKGK